MPDAKPIHLKLIFDITNGRILGCEGIGRGDVVKRIDVCAAMITMKATIYDLKDLELCYSPMYSTARDPLNHAALVAINILEGAFKQVHVKDVRNLIETKQVIIDVREPHEYKAGHMLGSINIPMSAFRQRLDEIPKDVNVYLHCRSGQRSYNVIRALQHLGYDNLYNISGSFLGVSYYEYYNDVTLNREKIVTAYNFK
jgi:rhodanese-related sulfurtransferase